MVTNGRGEVIHETERGGVLWITKAKRGAKWLALCLPLLVTQAAMGVENTIKATQEFWGGKLVNQIDYREGTQNLPSLYF